MYNRQKIQQALRSVNDEHSRKHVYIQKAKEFVRSLNDPQQGQMHSHAHRQANGVRRLKQLDKLDRAYFYADELKKRKYK